MSSRIKESIEKELSTVSAIKKKWRYLEKYMKIRAITNGIEITKISKCQKEKIKQLPKQNLRHWEIDGRIIVMGKEKELSVFFQELMKI